MFDRESAEKVANWLQDALFMMAVSNSCMNPLVYGSYAMNLRRECWRCLCCTLCPLGSNSQLARNVTGQFYYLHIIRLDELLEKANNTD